MEHITSFPGVTSSGKYQWDNCFCCFVLVTVKTSDCVMSPGEGLLMDEEKRIFIAGFTSCVMSKFL
jgi:hypothetical protein